MQVPPLNTSTMVSSKASKHFYVKNHTQWQENKSYDNFLLSSKYQQHQRQQHNSIVKTIMALLTSILSIVIKLYSLNTYKYWHYEPR